MSDIRNYMLTIEGDKDGASEIARNTAKRLENRETGLVNVVQSLAEYINDEDVTIRSKAVYYLTAVLTALPRNFLNRQQTQVLCQFFCDRIEDGGAVEGLLELQALDRFNDKMVTITVRALFEHYESLHLRSQSQRYGMYQLLNDMMANHRKALKDLGNESLTGITDLVSGERDPRNLMIIFSILRVIMMEWDISGHEEALFDAVYCYFPITFRPPPDDPYGITAQDLKNRLRECFVSTGAFAPFIFQNMIDKLDSTSPNVKKDVLQTIAACSSAYSATVMSKYSVTLWDALKYEILNAQSDELADEALTALRAIATQLSENNKLPGTTNDNLMQFLRPIIKECNEELQDPQQKKAKAASRILSSLAASSLTAFSMFEQAVMPPLLTIYQDVCEIPKERCILDIFGNILESAIEVWGSWVATSVPCVTPSATIPLEQFKETFFELFSRGLMGTTKEEVSFRISSLRGLLLMSKLRGYLQNNEIGMVVQYCDEIIITEEPYGNDDVKKAAIESLSDISTFKPDLIMDITFPAFIAKLPDTDVDTTEQLYLTTLEALATISVEKEIFETLIRRLLNKLDVVVRSAGSPAYAHAILSTILYILDRRKGDDDVEMHGYYDSIVVDLTRKVVSPTLGSCVLTALNDASVIEVLGHLCKVIVRKLGNEKQEDVLKEIYTLYSGKDAFQPIPLSDNPPLEKRNTMILSTYLLASLSPQIGTSFATAINVDVQTLLQRLTSLSLTETFAPARLAILRQLSLIINKHLTVATLPLAEALLFDPTNGLFNRPRTSSTIRTIFWVSRALVLRLHAVPVILEHLMSLVSETDATDGEQSTSSIAARGFSLLLAPDSILTQENGCIVRLLYKQRVFTTCGPGLAALFRSASTPACTKPNLLVALSGLLRYIDAPILLPHLDSILPLLLQSLDFSAATTKADASADAAVKSACLSTLSSLLVGNESGSDNASTPEALQEHIPSLIRRLLALAQSRQQEAEKEESNQLNMPPAHVRKLSVECLALLPRRFAISRVIPYRRSVEKGLLFVLDDPKRDVRRVAVDCREVWAGLEEDVEE